MLRFSDGFLIPGVAKVSYGAYVRAVSAFHGGVTPQYYTKEEIDKKLSSLQQTINAIKTFVNIPLDKDDKAISNESQDSGIIEERNIIESSDSI